MRYVKESEEVQAAWRNASFFDKHKGGGR